MLKAAGGPFVCPHKTSIFIGCGKRQSPADGGPALRRSSFLPWAQVCKQPNLGVQNKAGRIGSQQQKEEKDARLVHTGQSICS